MKHVVIIGLGSFGKAALDELLALGVDIFLIDKDKGLIDAYKDSALQSVIVNVLNVESLKKILPETADTVIIDMGTKIEASILAASYCAKLNIKTIIAKAETPAHGEILSLVGATKVVFPNQEAAKRITPQVLSDAFLNYMSIDDDIALAELAIPESLVGKKLIESGLRQDYGLNLLFIRRDGGRLVHCAPEYTFCNGDTALFCGSEKRLIEFGSTPHKQNLVSRMFKACRHVV
jgi:trk system potassium uptake protein TrkA